MTPLTSDQHYFIMKLLNAGKEDLVDLVAFENSTRAYTLKSATKSELIGLVMERQQLPSFSAELQRRGFYRKRL